MKWRTFADRELPARDPRPRDPLRPPVVRHRMARCPRHDQRSARTRMCLACHNEAWDEVGRRYAAQGAPAEPEGRVSAIHGQIQGHSPGSVAARRGDHNEEETMNISTELVEGELLPAVIEEPARRRSPCSAPATPRSRSSGWPTSRPRSST